MEEERYIKRQRIYKTIMLIVITIFLTFIVTTLYITKQYNLGKNSISSLLNLSSNSGGVSNSINYIKTLLDNYYLNEIDEEKAEEWAIQAYVASLGDPYTEYIPKDAMEEYTTSLMGNYVGVGIYMFANTEDNTIRVLKPIEGSPAEEAGILAGDIIISVNGVEYSAEEMNSAANNIKGEAGSIVTLKILRDQEVKTFEIARRKVDINPIHAEKLENNIGYIEISSFDDEVAESFKTKYKELENQGITSLIIDLRNNGGGLVDETLEIADLIVPKGNKLLITVDKEQKEMVETAKKDVLIDMPIIILVNGNTASSSEILAGALKDLNEATIVGTTTYGKGVIQQLLTLNDGSGLKVTIEEYYTPNKNKINGIGIEPDVIIELQEDGEDTQLQKAIEILKGVQK